MGVGRIGRRRRRRRRGRRSERRRRIGGFLDDMWGGMIFCKQNFTGGKK